jgi:hypothetical protein
LMGHQLAAVDSTKMRQLRWVGGWAARYQ